MCLSICIDGGRHDGEVQNLHSGRDAITPFE